MKTKIGEILLVLGIILFVVGAIGLIMGFIPQNAIAAIGALALVFVGTGVSIKRRARK